MLITFGDFATTGDGIITITSSPLDVPARTSGRALTVRNNIAIDVAVGGNENPLSSIIDMVHKIAAKIRSK